MANEQDDYPGQIARIEIDESAAICVEQIEDEITIAIASVVGVHFQVTDPGGIRRCSGDARL